MNRTGIPCAILPKQAGGDYFLVPRRRQLAQDRPRMLEMRECIHLDTLLAQEFIAPYQEESDPSLDARLKFVLDPNRCPDCIFI